MKYYVSLLVAVLCVFLLSTVYGQEVTPEVGTTQTPTGTNTLTPTIFVLTATPLPSTFTAVPATNTNTPIPAILTETISPTTIATEVVLPVASVTSPAVIIPVVPWSVTFADAFATPRPDLWTINGVGARYNTLPDSSTVVELLDTTTQFILNQVDLTDIGIEVVVDVQYVDAHLFARRNGDLSYEARLTTNGQVSLIRANQVITTLQLTSFTNSQQQQLRLDVVGDMIWVSVNGNLIINWQDTTPLPPGQVGFSAGDNVTEATPVRFSQATIYQPTTQTVVLTSTPTATIASQLPASPTPTATTTPLGGISRDRPDFTGRFLPDQPLFNAPNLNAITLTANDITSLRSAMNNPDVVIDLETNGNYTFINYMSGENLFGNCALPIVESGATVTINGNGATLNASATGFRIFCVNQGILRINNMTITGANLPINGGAGLVNVEGNVEVDNVRFLNNIASGTGTDGVGGAIFTYNAVTTIRNSIFQNNEANRFGGAVHIVGGSVQISNSIFNSNSADSGGAISQINNTPTITINENNVYEYNDAVEGGGVFYVQSGSLNESSSQIRGNTSDNEGSIFYDMRADDNNQNNAYASVIVTSSNIVGNESPLIGLVRSPFIDFIGNWWGNPNGPNPSDIAINNNSNLNVDVSGYRATEIASCQDPNDNDRDCLENTFETQYGFDPNDAYSIDPNNTTPDGEWDSDSDGLTNYEEQEEGTNPLSADTDGDGLTDPQELQARNVGINSNSNNNDSDGDGILDGNEDYDNDGLPNAIEITTGSYDFLVPKTPDSDPVIANLLDGDRDLDNDGLPNRYEIISNGSGGTIYNIAIDDTDGNGTDDGDEDYDNDGLINRLEVRANQASFPSDITNRDTDGDDIWDFDEDYDNDGLPNRIELTLNGGLTYDFLAPKTPNSDPVIADLLDGDRDLDNDGLPNRFEIISDGNSGTIYEIGNPDTDGDNTPDGDEDYDTDGLINRLEVRANQAGFPSDITNHDTDGDGIWDFDEDYDTDGLPNDIEISTGIYDFLMQKTADDNPTIADLLDGDRDLDGDGLKNRYELLFPDPNNPGQTLYDINNAYSVDLTTNDGDQDYDGDGLTNVQEFRAIASGINSDPTDLDGDTDNDGISDFDEDYDNDGLPNRIEITLSSGSIYDFLTAYSALRPEDDPSVATLLDGYRDLDGDGLINLYEIIPDGNGGTIYEIDNPDTDGNDTDDGDEDYDTDGLTNLAELTQILDGLGNPYYDFTVTDSGPNAGQGIPDGQKDPDNDLLTNQGEIIAGSDPFNADTDGDLLPDGFEVDQSQTDPTNPNSLDPITNDADADPDNDSLTNYQEYILGTNPREATVLVPSRFDSTVQLSPTEPVNADGQDTITITATVRDSAGRALPMVAVDWITTNTNFNITSTVTQTDENGVATAQVTSSVISSGIVEVRANDVVLGRPLLEFVGGNPAVNFTAMSSGSVLPGQSVIGVFAVTNADQLTSQNVEVTATLPFGQGTIVDIQTPANGVTLISQGANAVTWRIDSLAPEDMHFFTIRWRLASNVAQGVQVRLQVEIIAIDDRDTTNNQATVNTTAASSLTVPSTDQQSDKLDVAFTSNPTQAAIGSAVTLDATITNTSSEDLFNISGALPLLGNAYPNVVFIWPDPTRPGYLSAGQTANATMTYTLTENYPNLSPGQRTLTVWGIDSTTEDGESLVSKKALLTSLAISGAYIDVNITANPTQANIGDTVTFTVNVTNNTVSTSPATDLQVIGNLFSSPQILPDLAVGNSESFNFIHVVTADDRPALTALVQVTGTNFPAREARKTVWTTNQTTTAPAPNLTFDSPPQTITLLSGQPTNLTLFVDNAGNIPSTGGTLRVNIPFGIEVDAQLLADGGAYNSSTRVVQWSLGAMNSNAQVTRVVPLMVSSNVPIGTEFIIGAVLSTPDDESNINDNVHEISGQVELPVLTNVEFNPLNRNWLVANGMDQLSLELTVFDQLGNPLSGQTASFIADQNGVAFNPNPPSGTSDVNGKITISMQAEPNAVGPVNITALLSNGLTATTTINRRDNPVRITSDPVPTTASIGGRASYRVMVVNTETLDNNATSDTITLSANANPSLPLEWFTFTNNPLPLGFGEFRETVLNVTIPANVDCATYLSAYEITITAQGSILGEIGQVTTPLTITQNPPSASQVFPNNGEHIASNNVLFSWRSQAISATSTVYYRDQATGGSYTPVVLTQSSTDPRLYSTEIDFSSYATGSVIEWYGTITNGCNGISTIGSDIAPRTFTRVRRTTFVDAGYDFTVRDGYNLTQTVDNLPMRIQVQNEDTQSHQILLDVENPYDDLIIGFVGSGSIDQMVTLPAGGTFAGQLRVFTQETNEEVYYLTLRLENDEGDVDRIPLTITIQEPVVDIGVTILSVDDRTMITRARLVNRGDDLTDLTLDVRNEMGIPANIIIQPDIQHTYIRAGQTIDIAFVPLSIQETNQAPMSMQTYDPMTGMTMFNQSTPQMMSVPGPYKVVSETRGNEQEIELEGGEVVNECGSVAGSERTIAHECTMPAGSETYASEGWYCTNKPFISIPFTIGIPFLDDLINAVEVTANFSRGFTGEQLYSHSTTVTLNGSLVGSAIVPNQSQIQSAVPPGSLAFGGLNPTQLLNINSNHSNNNQAHYTVASGFTVTVDYDEHTRTGCFTQAEIDAAMGGTLMCTGDSIFDPPPSNRLELTLDVDQSELDVNQRDTPYDYEVGDTIPLLLSVDAAALSSDVNTVTVELTLPQELRPSDMAISEEPQSFINQILNFWRNLLNGSDTDQNVTVTADGTSRQLTYIYDRNAIGQQLAIDLDVVGELAGNYTITGEAFIGSEEIVQSGFSQLSTSGMQRQQNGFADASDLVELQIQQLPIDDACLITVATQVSIAFRYAPNTINNDPLFFINSSGFVTSQNNFPGQWENVINGNANDWLPDTQVNLSATRWSQFGETIWLTVTAENNSGDIIEGYMALRNTSDNNGDFLNLSCAENTIPGAPVVNATSTPGPSPTPDFHDWYVICTLRPNEPPPIEVNVRAEPSLGSEILDILGPGDMVRRTSLDISNEVNIVVGTGTIIFVEIEWADSVSGLAWVARQDALGELLETIRAVNCPPVTPIPVPSITPIATSTPDPRIPIADPGRFNNAPGGYQSPFESSAPSNVGSSGIHDKGTIDIMPIELEECIDTSRESVSTICDPQSETGIPVYAPVGGSAVPVNGNQNVVIFWEVEFNRDDDATQLPVRREIVLSHLDPTRLQIPSTGRSVARGELIGYLCHHNERDRCGIATVNSTVPPNLTDIQFNVNHLAVQVRFYNSSNRGFAPRNEEVLGVLAIPSCIFDNWVEDHNVRTPKDPNTATWLVNWFSACPSAFNDLG